MMNVPSTFKYVPAMMGGTMENYYPYLAQGLMGGLGGCEVDDEGVMRCDDAAASASGSSINWTPIFQQAIAGGLQVGTQAFNLSLAQNLKPGQVVTYTDPQTGRPVSISQQTSGYPIISGALPGGATTAGALGLSTGVIAMAGVGLLVMFMFMGKR